MFESNFENTEVKNNVEVKEENKLVPDFENEFLVSPFVNIYETENEFVLTADMPGVSKEMVNVEFENGHLSVYGRKNDSCSDKNYVLKETSCANYYRKFKLSDGIDSLNIEAKMVNGQLRIVLPKHERIKSKSIAIK